MTLTLTEVMGRLDAVYLKEGRGAFYGLALAMHPKTITDVFGSYEVEELNTESFHLPIVGDTAMQRDEMKVVRDESVDPAGDEGVAVHD
jgi:hypothetical protein